MTYSTYDENTLDNVPPVMSFKLPVQSVILESELDNNIIFSKFNMDCRSLTSK